MSDLSKVKPSHTQRPALVYIRQSSPTQVEYNRESTARQYALVDKACGLGCAKEHVTVIDDDLGVRALIANVRVRAYDGGGRSGARRYPARRKSPLVRTAAWYRLLDLCSTPII
jgi:hypothetical protein